MKLKNLLPLILVTLGMALITVLNFLPWKKLVELFSNIDLENRDCILVYSKSNLLKYVPGNVFQYVGRNALAVEKNIPHIQVALATIIDVMLTVIAASLISIFFLSDYILSFFSNHQSATQIGIVSFLLILLLFAMVVFFLREGIGRLLKRYRSIFSWNSLKIILFGLAYYIVVMLFSSLFYMIILIFVLDTSLTTEAFFQLFSAYTLAWLVGFVTPGAPAGLGIKEAVMMGVTGSILPIDLITLSMVILRVLSIIADVLAFLFAFAYNKCVKPN